MKAWEHAWRDALYGPGGFYRRSEGPAGHFRTAAHADAPALAAALLELARVNDCEALVDVGAGRGELLSACAALGTDLRLHGVDVVARPSRLSSSIGWSSGVEKVLPGTFGSALVVAWELLDVVPCPVLEVDASGVPRMVLVEPTGRESLGEAIPPEDAAWCSRWWPGDDLEEGDRIEVGRPRDQVWTVLAGQVRHAGGGVLLAVDYAHTREARPPGGSLSAFSRGRAVPPRPDGSCDLTAHVALDSVESAGLAAGATTALLTTQSAALRSLGVTSPELLDDAALGSFTWLQQRV